MWTPCKCKPTNKLLDPGLGKEFRFYFIIQQNKTMLSYYGTKAVTQWRVSNSTLSSVWVSRACHNNSMDFPSSPYLYCIALPIYELVSTKVKLLPLLLYLATLDTPTHTRWPYLRVHRQKSMFPCSYTNKSFSSKSTKPQMYMSTKNIHTFTADVCVMYAIPCSKNDDTRFITILILLAINFLRRILLLQQEVHWINDGKGIVWTVWSTSIKNSPGCCD